MSDRPVIIRADASHQIGVGHVMRCFSIAEEVIGKQGSVMLSSAPLPERIRMQFSCLDRCDIQGMTHVPGSMEDAQSLVETANQIQASWIIIDGPHFDTIFLEKLKQSQASLLLIDDLAERDRIDVNLLLNHHFIASKKMYPQVSERTTCLFGPKYLLLRRSIRQLSSHRETPGVARKIFVSMGGADPDRMLDRVLDALHRRSWEGREVIVAIGPNQNVDSSMIENASDMNVTFEYPADNIHKLIGQSDLAIVAAGGICYETAALNVPSLILTRCESHYQFMHPFEKLGMGKLISDNCTSQQIADDLYHLAHDMEIRQAMQAACHQQIDRRGVERVVSQMASF